MLLQEIPELDEEVSPMIRARPIDNPETNRKKAATSIFAAIKQDRVNGKRGKPQDSTPSTLESPGTSHEVSSLEGKRERKGSCTILEFMESKRKMA